MKWLLSGWIKNDPAVKKFTVKRKKKQERWPVRSKQAVRHSIVRRRESLQHKPTLHGLHKTWLLVPFYYHKTGGGKIKSGSVNVSLNQARSGWFLSHRSKYWLLYINLKNCMTSAWVPCCWLFSKNTSTRGRFAIPMSLRTQCMQKERRTTNVSCRHEITPHTVQSIDKLQIN